VEAMEKGLIEWVSYSCVSEKISDNDVYNYKV
jgi:hypothetical protein